MATDPLWVFENYGAAAELIDELEKQARWISVAERLPDISGLVMVYRPTAHEYPANDANVTIKPYSTTLGFGGCHAVTHWLPLPAAPGVSGKEGE